MHQPHSRSSENACDTPPMHQQLKLALTSPFLAETLFDLLDDVVFFVKDSAGRYVIVNRTLMLRCGNQQKSQLIGHTSLEVFPHELGTGYLAQDRYVLEHGRAIHNQLEMHLYANRTAGWCLTHKIPLFDQTGRVIGLAGISRDLRIPDKDHPIYQRVASVVIYIQTHYQEPLKLAQLAQIANLSIAQLERYIQRIFDLTPKQLIMKTRLDTATSLLAGHSRIADIAHICGYTDHSAFSRQFKAAVGLSPTQYRALRQRE